MQKVSVYNQNGEKLEEIELNSKIFGLAVKPELVTQAIIAQRANQRKVIAHTKNKGEVAGGGRKPWRQKGTGRARHGSIRSPLWRGGGVTFGPTNERNFSLKINKKAKRKAMLMALSDKARNQKIVLLDKLELDLPKTKKFFSVLQNLNLRTKKVKKAEIKKSESKKPEDEAKQSNKIKSVLLVLPQKDQKIWQAARNIARLNLILADSLNVLSIVEHQYLLLPVSALKQIEKTFVK